MDIFQIEKDLQKLMDPFSKETFIYDLLSAYGLPKSSIKRLQNGNLNLSKVESEISWKKTVFFKEVFEQDLHVTISELHKRIKNNERFVIATDYKTFLAIDTKTQDKLDIELKDLPKHYDFFLPWAGMEKAQYQNENPADVKAAEKMARLFDEIKKDNPDDSTEFIHGLNVFLCRLLFCFFAEDTNIFFKKGQFTNVIASHTQTDGSDLNIHLDKLFEVLNTPKEDRQNVLPHLNDFPYVNGGLFRQKLQVPTFTRRSHQAIIESGKLDWSIINPDIFGSMMQAVKTPELRGDSGIHYTSVPNIMKVIEPLFLNELKENFDAIKGVQEKRNELLKRLDTIKISDPVCRSDDFTITDKELHKLETEIQTKRQKLLERLWKIKIFDPACGSGNFLIIAYKELRRLEMRIFKELGSSLPFSGISLRQFYGIELDDFAHEIAQLSLWLAEHQMNVEFFKEFGRTDPTLPLKDAGNIVQGNACRIDWETVCPKKEGDEIYILGNPPYLGGKSQSEEQKEDMKIAFDGIKKIGELDYIACWFYKSVKYAAFQSAFVATSSICQGSQVQQLWPHVFNSDYEIKFAYKPFKWSNNAKNTAAVIVSIIGIGKKSNSLKVIYDGYHKKVVQNISPYLIESKNTIVYQNLKPISSLPTIITGNSPYDGGNLILSEEEKETLLKEYPNSFKFIKRLFGSQDYINGNNRWCLWITDTDLFEAKTILPISNRIEKTKEFRICGGDVAQSIAHRPHQFRYTHSAKNNLILVPRVSSERRKYIPFGFIDSNCIVSDSAQAIYDSEPFVFGIVSSQIHMAWVKTVSGRLKSDYRYSSALCYNTFPFPTISEQRKQEITQCVFRILEEREKHSEKTLAQLYDPDKMPESLREAHHLNDLAVDRCYRSKPFESDEERLEHLFKLYENEHQKAREE